MYFSYGWPKSLVTGATPADTEALYCCQAGGYLVVVFSASVQVWSAGQHRLKLGEAHRAPEALQEEGLNARAHWCPQKRVLAVATEHNHLQLYGLNVSSEALWRLPDGGEVRRVNVYLSHSLHLDYGPVRLADLGGDAKSLVVALSNGTLQVFSWQGKLRGQSNPFIAAYEGSRSRAQRSRSHSGLGPRASTGSLGGDSSTGDLPGAGAAAAATSAAAALKAAAAAGEPAASVALLAAMASLDLPQPTPALPAEVVVSRIHYAPAARMLAVVLADGRCALCRTGDAGAHPAEQLQLFRWVHKPAGPGAPAVVAAALNPAAQLLALGMSHGRVAIYTMQSLLSPAQRERQAAAHGGLQAFAAQPHHRRSGSGGSLGGGGGQGAGQPEPVRILSLADWGYRSAVVGAAAQLQWSPDGRVLAVGYSRRGMAVWTPSGCRLMCSLRQAVATAGTGGAPSSLAAGGPSASLQLSAATPTPADQQRPVGAAAAEGGGRGQEAAGGPGLWAQSSSLNPSQAPEAGVLEGGVTALAWCEHGYRLLVAQAGGAAALHQLEFARRMAGSHRVVAGGDGGDGHGELQALQAADRVLLISEARAAAAPALRLPAGAPGGMEAREGEGGGGGGRPELLLQHVRAPQQYVEAAYPLLHAAISPDRQDVAVAGTCGLAVYSRRAQRWRLFGDATQERSIRVQGLMWLPGGVVAAVAFVEGGGRGGGGDGAPQLLLYPRHHLDNASLMARLALPQVPVAMDSSGWHLVLAFAPLELKLYRVSVEGQHGPGAAKAVARLSVVRELSIMGLGNPLQEIALIDPLTLPREDAFTAGTAAGSDGSSLAPTPAAQPEAPRSGSGEPGWPALPPVATRPRTPTGAEPLGAHAPGDTPLQCVLLRAGGIMSKLDMQEGSEVLLSDAIERFWLPTTPVAPAGAHGGDAAGAAASAGTSAGVSRASSFAVGGSATPEGSGGGGLSASSSMAALGRHTSDAELSAAAAAATAARFAAAAAAADGGDVELAQHRGQPPRVEMPWWTYGARGMQLWFPSSLSEPLTPSLRSLASPTATGLAAAAAAAATNSTDPELEFDREVYPIGVSLAEVSIIGVMQRSVRSQAFPPEAPQSLCFHPLPESQPVLPCLLRRLLQKGRFEDALELARWHSAGPHFNRSLEWLLFTALESDADSRPAGGYGGPAAPPILGSPVGAGRAARQARFNSSYAVTVGGGAQPRSPQARSSGARPAAGAGPLLAAAANLIAQFPQFPEVVVSVARKTDAALWPALFAAVGSPLRLCQGLMEKDKLQSAACCLVIVEQIEGPAPAQQAALLLIQAALGAGQYGLAADLLRFLVPPGESGEALLSPASAGSGKGGAGAEAQPAQQQQQPPSAAAAAAQQEEQPQSGGWFWGLFGGGAAPAPAEQAAARPPTPPVAPAQQQGEEEEEDTTAAGEAWRLTAAHAWKLLDSGALRAAAQLAGALAEMHGGLAVLLAATAEETPAAAAHMAPSAAAVASALFVAANEFLGADSELDAALAAEQLMAVCQDAGCVNLAAALALLLGDQPALQAFQAHHPVVWEQLYGLISNDVHLCGFAPVLSPLPSPTVVGGAAALLQPA